MKKETKDILLKLIRKCLYGLLLLAALDLLYRFTLYPKDLEQNCTLIDYAQKPIAEHADMVYLGESSNHTYGFHDTDTSYISEMIARQFPSRRLSTLSKDACHAAIYYDMLRNIPRKNDIQTVIVTVNMRSFGSEWIYSDLETPLQKEQIFMKKAPALYKRLLIAFKAYSHWSDDERHNIIKKGLRHQTIKLPYYFPYKNAAEWDMAIGTQDHLYDGRQVSWDTIALTCHYIKCFAYQLDDNNPRIQDFDRIVKLCKRRGWQPVFNILADNMEQIKDLVGPDLVYIMKHNAQYIIERYAPQGVIVVNNQNIVSDRYFRDRDFPTEHYEQAGREAIATAIAEKIKESNK